MRSLWPQLAENITLLDSVRIVVLVDGDALPGSDSAPNDLGKRHVGNHIAYLYCSRSSALLSRCYEQASHGHALFSTSLPEFRLEFVVPLIAIGRPVSNGRSLILVIPTLPTRMTTGETE